MKKTNLAREERFLGHIIQIRRVGTGRYQASWENIEEDGIKTFALKRHSSVEEAMNAAKAFVAADVINGEF